jgi:hypothetical protein
MAEQIQPSCFYPEDPNFPIRCDFDYAQAYCCLAEYATSNDDFVTCKLEVGDCVVGPPGCHMTFPYYNDEDQPTLKTAINATTKSAWVKIAFQQYCGSQEDPGHTEQTIITMGNHSQFNDEQCKATIKGFQYGWGTTNQGNRCRITIMDQKGSEFQMWVERMGINPEGDSVPVQGKYRMKVQFGWYLTGGGSEDRCGQPAGPPLGEGDVPAEGENSSYIICSPVMYFITQWVNVNFENGKFIYELEGTDLLERGQEQMIEKVFGGDGDGDGQMYFTKAVELLGKYSFPPFRVEFKAINAAGDVVDMEFVKRDGVNYDREFPDDGWGDCKGYGPRASWRPNQKPPLAAIQDWLLHGPVTARDLTGKITSDKGRVGITMNYDPTYKFVPNGEPDSTTNDPCATCKSDQPQYGRLILWASGIPYCQGNFTDTEINDRMKAVYLVNAGNCSPVLQFTPAFKWHMTEAALQTQTATFHHIMANLAIGAIEADLRVEGDPSSWLCSPIEGYGKCVGIVFVNPFFLVPGASSENCPVWRANDGPVDPEDPEFLSICNELLTSKGWFLMGVDHQIKDGQFVTNLKLKLLAPGAELNPAGSVTALGGWADGTTMPYGGQFGCLDKYLVGSAAAGWGAAAECLDNTPNLWVGGGTFCEGGYDSDPDLPPT